MVKWIDRAIIRLNLRHLEPMWNWFTLNLLRERWLGVEAEAIILLMTSHLKLSNPMFQLPNLSLEVIFMLGIMSAWGEAVGRVLLKGLSDRCLQFSLLEL